MVSGAMTPRKYGLVYVRGWSAGRKNLVAALNKQPLLIRLYHAAQNHYPL